ncbi:uncharacterized protein LOC120272808 [Dioscorea cayenensis subsp. rotundata]|uniref:Uncharacterized protein LOC120272808 n=1 Tax=Dioscorea cayennensis subsp. rotundata TaxID=55577 RepID=A0AB40C6T7_DIOCR|nr:uncharacterized protein LOC120272808 [Dioscorea cayenensis subsp. rotundata]
MGDSEEKICTILEEWERWKKGESSSSHKRSQRHLNGDRKAGHGRLFNDYFADELVYPDNVCHQRFQIRKALFLQIAEALASRSEYFQLRVDSTSKRGLSLLSKICIIKIFAARYLRRSNNDDVGRLLQLHSERHGFPDMLGSIDCIHWHWKNCPVSWKGQFT